MAAPENFDYFMAEILLQFTTYFKNNFYTHFTHLHTLFTQNTSLPTQLTTYLTSRFHTHFSTTQELFPAFIILSLLLFCLLSLITRVSWTSLASLHITLFLAVLPFMEISMVVTVEVLTWTFLGLGAVEEVGDMMRWVFELRWWSDGLVVRRWCTSLL